MEPGISSPILQRGYRTIHNLFAKENDRTDSPRQKGPLVLTQTVKNRIALHWKAIHSRKLAAVWERKIKHNGSERIFAGKLLGFWSHCATLELVGPCVLCRVEYLVVGLPVCLERLQSGRPNASHI